MRLVYLGLLLLLVLPVLVPAQSRAVHSASFAVESESEIFAQRGNGVVTQADFDVFLQRLPRHHRPEFLADPDRIGDALERLMLPRQIVARAREEGFVDESIRQHQMYQVLTVFLADEYVERRWQEARLDDYTQQAEELFLTRPDLLRSRQKVDFTHILIRAGSERGDLDAMRAILAIYDALLEGAELSELVVEYSEDPSVSDNHGRFEGVEIHSLDERFGQMVRFLQPGQISEPFRSSFGWHVVELHDRYRTEAESFDQVRERALELAERRHREAWRERFMSELANQPTEFQPGGVATLLDRYQATEQDIEKISRDVLQRMGLD